jgi:hypothetical protein
MPIQNTQGSFSTGRDVTLVVMGPNGRLDLANVTNFNAKQQTTNILVNRLDGVKLNAELPTGWTGAFTVERGNSGVDDFFAQAESSWIDGGIYQVSTIYQYITETSGTSTYQFDNVALKLDDAGDWAGDKSTKQTVSFTANRRRKI